AIGDAAAPAEHATAGYYAVRASILREADAARRDEVSALRAFFARLLARGYPMVGIAVPQSIDVDRPHDVDAADHLLKRVTLCSGCSAFTARRSTRPGVISRTTRCCSRRWRIGCARAVVTS